MQKSIKKIKLIINPTNRIIQKLITLHYVFFSKFLVQNILLKFS